MSKPDSGWQTFLHLCLMTKEENTLAALLDFLLSPEERKSLSTRCLVIKALLMEDKPQRYIAKDLKVSIAKITRGSNELKRIHPKLLKFLKTQLLS